MNYSQEKLEYLRKQTAYLNLFVKLKLGTLKRHGASQEELDFAEYAYRFSSYQKRWDKAWKDSNWGEKEGESLSAFADSALEQEIAELRESQENERTR